MNANAKMNAKNKIRKFVLLSFLVFALLNFVCGETLEGKIIMWDTEEVVNGSALEIYKGASLISKKVCENGTYSINLPQGNYYFIAFYIDEEGDKYVSEENLTIINFTEPLTFDFILLPYLNFSETDYEISEFEINFSEIDKKSDGAENKTNNESKNENNDGNLMIWIIIAIVAIITVIFAVFGIGKFRKFNNKESDKNEEIEVNETKESKINRDVEKERSEENEGYKKDEAEGKNTPPGSEITSQPFGDFKNEVFEITKGMKDITGTLTQNELSVVEILIKYDKTLTRAEISRGTGISRSSLSAALTRLEQGKIVEVDRTYMMHSVRLTGWFKSLK
ncbi:exported hypothetical protein [groundwater metagenome]|uniref:HTH iclR-type domain-containing protein n=1 Tax=groundwater metagenome TaxID=717931 RepID=A0A098EB16_9ZZZZ